VAGIIRRQRLFMVLMSTTTLYAVLPDGTLSEQGKYNNGHGSGPAVWSILAPKYLPNVNRATRGDERFWDVIDPAKRHWMEPAVLKELCALANAGGMAEYERRTMWATCDDVVVRIEDVGCYAAAMAKFAEIYGPIQDRRAFSIGDQAKDMQRIYDEHKEEGWRGVCWQQHSCSNNFGSGEMTEARRADLLGARLADLNLSPDLIKRIFDELHDWDPEESVPYNIDIDTRHQICPSASVFAWLDESLSIGARTGIGSRYSTRDEIAARRRRSSRA
jgi:hypothetical protein